MINGCYISCSVIRLFVRSFILRHLININGTSIFSVCFSHVLMSFDVGTLHAYRYFHLESNSGLVTELHCGYSRVKIGLGCKSSLGRRKARALFSHRKMQRIRAEGAFSSRDSVLLLSPSRLKDSDLTLKVLPLLPLCGLRK